MSDIMNNEQIFANCTEILSQIINDNSVPRNIRRADVIEFLKNLSGFDVDRVHIEDKFGDDDPNIPIHARILIWNILSELEAVKD